MSNELKNVEKPNFNRSSGGESTVRGKSFYGYEHYGDLLKLGLADTRGTIDPK